MTQRLWRPSLGRKADADIDRLLETVETMVREGQEAELRNLIGDLQDLIQAVRDLISKMQAAKKGFAFGQKGTVEEAMSEIRKRIHATKPERKGPLTGREVVASIAEQVQRRLG